jgi:hypothetical protein
MYCIIDAVVLQYAAEIEKGGECRVRVLFAHGQSLDGKLRLHLLQTAGGRVIAGLLLVGALPRPTGQTMRMLLLALLGVLLALHRFR